MVSFACWENFRFLCQTGCYILLLQSWQLCRILDILWTHFDWDLAGSQLSWVTMNANNTLQFLSVNTRPSFQASSHMPCSHTLLFQPKRAEFSCCLRKKRKKYITVNGFPLISKKSWIFFSVQIHWGRIREDSDLYEMAPGGKVIPFPGPEDRGQQGCGVSVLTGAGDLASMAMHTPQSCCKHHQILLETSGLPVWGGVSDWSKTPLRI